MLGFEERYRGNQNIGFVDFRAPKVSNKEARAYVQEKRVFKGSNTAGTHRHGHYVVYSYGYHWPLFICLYGSQEWIENGDRYSVSTSKHRSQLHPLVNTRVIPRLEIRERYGI